MVDYARIRMVLEELYLVYPKRVHYTELESLTPFCGDYEKLLFYLYEHHMITFSAHMVAKGEMRLSRVSITARGIDFIQPDGGLSALAAPTIRISPENLIAAIDAALNSRNLTIEQRSLVQDALRVAGTEGIKTIVQRLVDAGLTHAPDILRLFTLP